MEREPLRWKTCHSFQADSTSSVVDNLMPGAWDSGKPAILRTAESYHAYASLLMRHSPDSRALIKAVASCLARSCCCELSNNSHRANRLSKAYGASARLMRFSFVSLE